MLESLLPYQEVVEVVRYSQQPRQRENTF
jgi:hypothetical protein